MPDASQPICPRRHAHVLLALWLAFAVSHLFSVLPFGNATSGFMAPIPSTQLLDRATTAFSTELPALTDSQTWEGSCQVIWAALNDLPHDDAHVGAEADGRRSAVAGSAEPPAADRQRAPLSRPGSRYDLRAPPHRLIA